MSGPDDLRQVTVRFRDSRIAFGASRYCNASVTNSFMETLTPLNQVILYGTLTQPPAVESHVCAVQPHSEAGATTRKRARPAAVEREGLAMVGEVETERRGAPPKKRKDPHRSNDPPAVDGPGIGQASAVASVEARDVTSTGISTSSPRQSTGGVTIQPLETISQLRRSYFSPHANLLRPPITGGQAKSRQIQRHNWEQALAGVDSADLEVASTFDMWQWLALRHTWRCIAPGCSRCASVANHAADADVLALRDIGCHVGHVKYFRPLEMQPEDASSGAHRRRANSGLSSGYCSSSARSRSSSFSFTDRGVPSESSQELERSLALFEPAAAGALSHRSYFCALNGDSARPERTPCTPLTPLEEHLLQLERELIRASLLVNPHLARLRTVVAALPASPCSWAAATDGLGDVSEEERTAWRAWCQYRKDAQSRKKLGHGAEASPVTNGDEAGLLFSRRQLPS